MTSIRMLLLCALAACGGKEDSAIPQPGTSSGAPTTGTTGTLSGTVSTPPTVPCPAGTSGPALETSTACYRGRTSDGVEGFLGIAYAEPPVGDLRWARPAAIQPTLDPVDALSLGSPCIQSNGTVDLELAAGDGSEDCLTLNVLRPVGAQPGDDRPILFFVHGGGHVDGHGGSAAMLGGSFNRDPGDPPLVPDAPQIVSEQGAIVVTVNYRLGQLGWLAHPGLSAESIDGASGNQGLWDVLLALEWVNDNAVQLGGDPDHVLLFGESAGSVSTCALLTSDLARGLFDAAILQSGVCGHIRAGLDSAPLLVETAHAQGDRLAAGLGCTGDASAQLACMRGKPATEVMAVMQAGWGSLDLSAEAYGPVVDGVILPEPPGDRLAAGNIAPVPVVLGVTADEGTLFTTFAPIPTEPLFDTALAAVALAFGWDVAGLQALYDPATNYGGDLQAAYAAAYADLVFVCPTRQLADQLAAHTDVHAYWWTHPNPVTQGLLGVHHGVEISYTFGTGLDLGAQGTMNDVATSAWASIAAGGPTVSGVGAWPPFGDSVPDGGTWVELATTPSVMGTGPRKSQCDWMDAQ